MNIYDSNTENEFSKKNEAFYNYYRGYDSNHRKSGNNTTLFDDLIKVFYFGFYI